MSEDVHYIAPDPYSGSPASVHTIEIADPNNAFTGNPRDFPLGRILIVTSRDARWGHSSSNNMPLPRQMFWQVDDDENVEPLPGEKYFAVLAFDGDQIGKWLRGDFLASNADLQSHHSRFSKALSNFALKQVRPIVEKPVAPSKKHGGFLVYAGGDDVVALLPAERAVECAQELQESFRATTEHIVGEKKEDSDADAVTKVTPVRPDASVGIAIAHFKAPLQDVVRAAQAAEKRAKQKLGRSAVAVSLFKRSGEILEWGCQWEDGGLALHELILGAMLAGKLSAKFPHRVIKLIDAYRIAPSPLSAATFTDVSDFAFNVDELVHREFAHTLSRQHGPHWPDQKEKRETLTNGLIGALGTYLKQLGDAGPTAAKLAPQEKLTRLTGLLAAVAFAARNREDEALKLPANTPVSADLAP